MHISRESAELWNVAGFPAQLDLGAPPQLSAVSLLMEIKSCYLNGYSLAFLVCQTRWHDDCSWQEPRGSNTNCDGSFSL